jgi:hypothetical protein
MMTFTDDSKPRKSNMFFSCGPGQDDRQVVPSKYWREDEHGCHYYKLTAPVFVDMKDINNKVRATQVNGPVIFTARGDSFWGGERSKNYRSKVVENPTYRALLGAAKSSQKVTRDYHHSFIEGVTFGGYEEVDGRQVMILQLQFGS